MAFYFAGIYYLSSNIFFKTKKEGTSFMNKFLIYIVLIVLSLNVPPVLAATELTAKDYYNQGWMFEQEQDYIGAIATYSKAIETYPNEKSFYAARSRSYFASEKYDLALIDSSKFIEMSPSDFGGYLNRGNIYTRSEQYSLAIADYTHSIELRDTFFAHKARGDAYVRIHRYDLAMIDFNQMEELWPHDSDVYVYKAQLYGLLGDYNKAMEECNIGLKEYPQNPIILFDLAQCYELLGNKELAIAYYRRALNKEMSDLYTKKTAMLKNKINARLVGDWESYIEWIYY